MKFTIALFVLVVFVYLMQRRRARKLDALWAAVAQNNPGLTFTPGKGFFVRQRIEGMHAGHALEMRGYFGSAGRGRVGLIPHVALQVKLSGNSSEQMLLRRRRYVDRLGGSTIEVGDDIMDNKWWLATSPEAFGRKVFATRISLRNRIAFLNDVEITLADGLLRMTKPGPPLTPGYFGILLEFISDLAAAIEQELAQ